MPLPPRVLDAQIEASLGTLRRQIDLVRLITTVAAGIAATLVASSLQQTTQMALAISSSLLLLATLLATVGVARDRFKEPDIKSIFEKERQVQGRYDLADDEVEMAVRRKSFEAMSYNIREVGRAKRLASTQLVLAGLTAMLSIIALLHERW